MSLTNPDDEVNFWPGYVDAIFNFALNILFVVGLLVIMSSMMDFSGIAEARKAAQSAGAGHNPTSPVDASVGAQPLIEEPINPPIVAVIPVEIALPNLPFQAQPNSRVRDAEPTLDILGMTVRDATEGAPLLTIDFADHANRLPPDKRQELTVLLNSFGAEVTQQPWLIWSQGDARQTAQARQAYMRLMNVRSALVDAGLPSALIEIRILDVRESALPTHNRVFIAPKSLHPQRL